MNNIYKNRKVFSCFVFFFSWEAGSIVESFDSLQHPLSEFLSSNEPDFDPVSLSAFLWIMWPLGWSSVFRSHLIHIWNMPHRDCYFIEPVASPFGLSGMQQCYFFTATSTRRPGLFFYFFYFSAEQWVVEAAEKHWPREGRRG